MSDRLGRGGHRGRPRCSVRHTGQRPAASPQPGGNRDTPRPLQHRASPSALRAVSERSGPRFFPPALARWKDPSFPHCTVRHGSAHYCVALRCIALHCVALRCTALHCAAALPSGEERRGAVPRRARPAAGPPRRAANVPDPPRYGSGGGTGLGGARRDGGAAKRSWPARVLEGNVVHYRQSVSAQIRGLDYISRGAPGRSGRRSARPQAQWGRRNRYKRRCLGSRPWSGEAAVGSSAGGGECGWYGARASLGVVRRRLCCPLSCQEPGRAAPSPHPR